MGDEFPCERVTHACHPVGVGLGDIASGRRDERKIVGNVRPREETREPSIEFGAGSTVRLLGRHGRDLGIVARRKEGASAGRRRRPGLPGNIAASRPRSSPQARPSRCRGPCRVRSPGPRRPVGSSTAGARISVANLEAWASCAMRANFTLDVASSLRSGAISSRIACRASGKCPALWSIWMRR